MIAAMKSGDLGRGFTGLIAAIALGPVAAIALAAVLLAYVELRAPRPGCEIRTILSQSEAPDHAWVATIWNSVCSDGWFVTTIDDTVEIRTPNEPAAPVPTGVVFGMDDHPFGVQKTLAVRWIAPRSLEITIPNDAWAGVQKSTFGDVTITYKYVPDDPVERACLRVWRSLPTEEMVRRSQSPTDNIKAFVAKCHAEGGPH